MDTFIDLALAAAATWMALASLRGAYHFSFRPLLISGIGLLIVGIGSATRIIDPALGGAINFVGFLLCFWYSECYFGALTKHGISPRKLLLFGQ